MDIAKAIRVHLNRHVKPYPDMLVDDTLAEIGKEIGLEGYL